MRCQLGTPALNYKQLCGATNIVRYIGACCTTAHYGLAGVRGGGNDQQRLMLCAVIYTTASKAPHAHGHMDHPCAQHCMCSKLVTRHCCTLAAHHPTGEQRVFKSPPAGRDWTAADVCDCLRHVQLWYGHAATPGDGLQVLAPSFCLACRCCQASAPGHACHSGKMLNANTAEYP